MAILYLMVLCTVILTFSSLAIFEYDKPSNSYQTDDAYCYLFDVYNKK